MTFSDGYGVAEIFKSPVTRLLFYYVYTFFSLLKRLSVRNISVLEIFD